jgi:hypothetical protein
MYTKKNLKNHITNRIWTSHWAKYIFLADNNVPTPVLYLTEFSVREANEQLCIVCENKGALYYRQLL